MKTEYILRFTKIILVSNEKEDYDKIKQFGFQKITWFKSPSLACAYFKEKKEQIKDYGVYFEHAKRGINSIELRNLLWENKESIIRVELYTNRYIRDSKTNEEISLKRESMHKVDVYKDSKPEEVPNKFIVSDTENSFINHESALKRVLALLKKKNLYVSIKDLQILYVDYFLTINKLNIEEKLKDKGWNVTFLDWGEKIENPRMYDIVIAKSGFSIASIEKETKQSFFRATFKTLQDAGEKENFPLSYTIGRVITIKENTKKEEYRLANLEKEFEIESLLHSVTSLMLRIGNMRCKEQIKSTIDYDREYLQKGKETLKIARARNEACTNFEMLINLLKTYEKRNALEYAEWNENSLYIECNKDKEFYIEYYHENNIYGTLRLPINTERNCKIFTIQTITKKGKLTPSKKVGIYSEKFQKKKDFPPSMNEKELALYNSVWLKAFRILPNAIERAKEEEKIARLKLTKKL